MDDLFHSLSLDKGEILDDAHKRNNSLKSFSVLCHKTSKEKECFIGHNEHWCIVQAVLRGEMLSRSLKRASLLSSTEKGALFLCNSLFRPLTSERRVAGG